MTRQATARSDFVPHLPELVVSLSGCWRAIRDAQTEVNPFGQTYGALEEARVGLELLVDRLTGQPRFLAMAYHRARR